MQKENIKNLSLQELQEVLSSWQEKLFHARQVFRWIYKKGSEDFSLMSDLPPALRKKLGEKFILNSLQLSKAVKSSDGTEKFLFELADKHLIEAVSIPAKGRVTGCISTQAGCKFGCAFCASGKLGFRRNLAAAEILDQVLYLKNKSSAKELTHIVFMGTGEPFDNYKEVLKAVRMINSPDGLNIGARRITISTAGLIPGIEKLSKEGLQIELSVSLHAADNKTRDAIMPINKIYPLEDLISSCRAYFKATNRQVTFEYVLIQGLNSNLQSVQKLGRILTGMDCKVNLIPANPIAEQRVFPPQSKDIALFKNTLLKIGVNVTLRRPRGQDIDAACGQLRLKYEKK